ncbi:MAG: hypothetical protein IJM51_02855 [Clostridia bacterium]|nr:hypothetical protein [Clostridia bacterium]
MAKKKLSTEEKITRYKRKRRIGFFLRILIPLVAVLAIMQASYYGFYYVVFTVMPQSAYDPDKSVGSGYSKPLHMMAQYENKYTYVLAYYYGGCWNVVDDTEKLKANRDNFMIYKEDDKWHEGTHLQLMIYENSYLLNNVPLAEFTLIDDRCFKDCLKQMTMEEFIEYCEQKGFKNYIQ